MAALVVPKPRPTQATDDAVVRFERLREYDKLADVLSKLAEATYDTAPRPLEKRLSWLAAGAQTMTQGSKPLR
jgi:hypothetical protein